MLFCWLHTHIHTDKFDKMMITFWMYSVLASVFVLAASQSTCPTDWFTAEFTIVADRVLNAAGGEALLEDRNGSYFTEVLGFSASRIAAEVEAARAHFNTRFGLQFPELDENNEARFQNATLSYFRVPFAHFVTVNRWIATGNTRSRCIDAFNGGLRVQFSGTQIVRGTYGGAAGRTVVPREDMVYGYYSINACRQQPILIQYQSNNPGRANADGYIANDNRITHPQLGTGFEIAIFRVEPNYNNDPTLLRSRFYSTIYFPNPPPIMGA